MSSEKLYKLGYYVPESHLEATKSAVFAAGGGRIGNYAECCWQTKGQGQFRPMEGSTPFLGTQGDVEVLDEYRVELVCSEELLVAIIEALRESHPYEEPAYDVVRLEVF